MHDDTNPSLDSSTDDNASPTPPSDSVAPDPDHAVDPTLNADLPVDAEAASLNHGQPQINPYGIGLQFRDFVPQQLSNFGLFKVAEYETFEAAVLAANHWLIEAPVELIQLETVVLPNIWSKYEEGTTDGSLGTSTGATSHWHQFLRVWYRPCTAETTDRP